MKLYLNPDDFDAVVFDFDGTLVDSLGLWHYIDKIYLARFEISPPKDLSEAISGMSFTETAQYFKDRFGLDKTVEEIKEDWIDLSHNIYINKILFREGAIAFLNAIKQIDKKMAVATSNQAYTTETFLSSRGMDIFDSYNYSCDAKKGKPYPYVYLNAAKDLQVDPSRCIAFEDTLEGVQAAKSAGMTVIAVEEPYSLHKKDEIEELADYYIKDYNDLILGEKNRMDRTQEVSDGNSL